MVRFFAPARRSSGTACLLVLMLVTSLTDAVAQPPNVRQQQAMKKKIEAQMKQAAANQPVLPADPQLLSLHREFITKAEKLASEYEAKKQYDRAREVYESLIRLVPKYGKAEAGLKRILTEQTLQDRELAEIAATKEWQDSGATIMKGMPVHFDVRGKWKVVVETGPEGVQIPDKMKPRNSRIQLGTLIGVIVTNPAELAEAKPFVVTPGHEFVAEKTGRLFLRMYDIDPTDNEGKMYVLIQSTFAK